MAKPIRIRAPVATEEVLAVIEATQPRDFLFSVRAAGTPWDVYSAPTKPWSFAVRILDDERGLDVHLLKTDEVTPLGAARSIEVSWGEET